MAVYPRSRADEPTITALRDWLLEEARRSKSTRGFSKRLSASKKRPAKEVLSVGL